jgi:hypothetical protein
MMIRPVHSRWLIVQGLVLMLTSTLVACETDGTTRAASASYTVSVTANSAPDYLQDVQSIFNRRCIACHGCLGSPCNVKLDSFRGLERGGFGLNPYSNHLGTYPRTDMDAANNVAEWRKKGFYPIVAREGNPAKNLDQSLLYLLVKAGESYNVRGFSRAAANGLRPQRYLSTCPSTPAALRDKLENHPGIGMPFGLPALSHHDFETLTDWVAAGSPGPTKAQRLAAGQIANPGAVVAWEAFFNATDKRAQLVSRYIFEHVFLARIILEESPGDQFRLVRSSTPPAHVVPEKNGHERIEVPPVEIIGTGLPYDDPYSYANVDHFWYRLEKLTVPAVQKNQFIWKLSLKDIDHLKRLFALESGDGWDTQGDLTPPWGSDNAMRTFAAIPARARSRFLLENSEVIVGGITYGPVCNGQTATYAVKDQFWVFFLDPDHDPSVLQPRLNLPHWETFMDRSVFGNSDYLKAFAATKKKLFPDGWSLDAIWDGDGSNRNAWLTILRHETNVSVLKGARGGMPRSLWLISYAGFERMYYDTVAGFAYWEGDGRKLKTLLFFNFLRQAFEDHFLTLLPAKDRDAIRHEWTQGGVGVIGLAAVPFPGVDQPSQVKIEGNDPLLALVKQIEQHLGPRISGLPDMLNPAKKPQVKLASPIQSFEDWEAALSTLTATEGLAFVPQLPSVIVLRLTHGDKHRVYSLIANRVYATQYTLLFQDGEAMPEKDSMSAYRTLVNGFPNLFVDLDLKQASAFLTDLSAVATRADWTRFESRYGILRNSKAFWPFYDWINDWNFKTRGDLAGWLDLTYYDAPEQ